ncbi:MULTISPECIES: hypothetical protein [Rhodobacterales]|uniref:hypothetical protein n=1 Tax=Rhodobacterales TaxID=204455 RepID=UPI003298512D
MKGIAAQAAVLFCFDGEYQAGFDTRRRADCHCGFGLKRAVNRFYIVLDRNKAVAGKDIN